MVNGDHRQGVDRCFSTAEALPVVFELQPNLDTYNALMHVLGNMRKVNGRVKGKG